MTPDYKLDAMFELRKFLWKRLVETNIFDADDYWSDNLDENIVPLIPVQQSAEMNQFLSGKKHIVYDRIAIGYDENWLICNDQILFTIYTTDVLENMQIVNFMVDEFRRMDEAAKDVNYWENLSDKFKFHTIYISDVSPTGPSEELQGFFTTEVVLEVKYSRITDGSGRFL